MSDTSERAEHWEATYRRLSSDEVSWHQREPSKSLELLDLLGIGSNRSLIDVGGGASVLADFLVARGFDDITVLDISHRALDVARERLPDATVHWLVADLLTWKPQRQFDVWHDRAALHFLHGDERLTYRALISRALAPDGVVILGTFALDGPQQCSGLDVEHYNAASLLEILGNEFELVAETAERHVTPSGAVQPFQWIAARRKAS